MFRFGLILIATSVAAASLPTTVAAQTPCGERTDIIDALSDKFGEQRRTMALTGGDRPGVFETFANDDTGSWTMIVTYATGPTCIMAAGEGFATEEPELADEL